MNKYKAIEDFLSLHTCTEVTDFAITEGKWSFKSKGSIHDYMVEQVIKGISVFEFSVCGNEDKFNSSFSDYVYSWVEDELTCIDSEVTVDYPELQFTDCQINSGLISFIDHTGRAYVQSTVNNKLFEHIGSTVGFYWVLSNSSIEEIKNRINEASVLTKVSKELINFNSSCSDIKGYLKVTNSEPLMKYDPTNGEQCPYPSNPSDYREYHGKVAWLYNPYSGGTRTAGDVGSDVFGHLIKPV